MSGRTNSLLSDVREPNSVGAVQCGSAIMAIMSTRQHGKESNEQQIQACTHARNSSDAGGGISEYLCNQVSRIERRVDSQRLRDHLQCVRKLGNRELLARVDVGGEILEVNRQRGLDRATAWDHRLALEHLQRASARWVCVRACERGVRVRRLSFMLASNVERGKKPQDDTIHIPRLSNK